MIFIVVELALQSRCLKEYHMNALLKAQAKTVAPVRKTARKASAHEMHERVKERFPKVMARLAE